MLSEHFANKRILINSCLNDLVALLAMQSKSSWNLRKLIEEIQRIAKTLEELGCAAAHNDFFIFTIIRLLNNRSRQEILPPPVQWHHELAAEKPSQCAFCWKRHYILACPQFARMEPRSRKNLAQSSKLCINCFGNHSVRICPFQKSAYFANSFIIPPCMRSTTCQENSVPDAVTQAFLDNLKICNHNSKETKQGPSKNLAE
ncbi:hypothetical protein PUN28_019409 [Cardiocondyla obscurior]|uniref:Uncharacterized protein n=1 Tax=Cardiocondyla obscurior TaxID=286306 RepID=A0AAW2EE35_9HYME